MMAFAFCCSSFLLGLFLLDPNVGLFRGETPWKCFLDREGVLQDAGLASPGENPCKQLLKLNGDLCPSGVSGRLGSGCIKMGLFTKLLKDFPGDMQSIRFFLDGGVFSTNVIAGVTALAGVFTGDLAFFGVVIIPAMAAMISTAALVGVFAGGVTSTGM